MVLKDFFHILISLKKIQLPFDTNPWESYLKHTKSLKYLLSEDASKQDSPCLRKWFLKGYFYKTLTIYEQDI